jgi:hypothetical protein
VSRTSKAVAGVEKGWRRLLHIELILLRFRRQEPTGESGPDEVIERLMNVRVGIGRHCNLSQRDKPVGDDRKRKKAE